MCSVLKFSGNAVNARRSAPPFCRVAGSCGFMSLVVPTEASPPADGGFWSPLEQPAIVRATTSAATPRRRIFTTPTLTDGCGTAPCSMIAPLNVTNTWWRRCLTTERTTKPLSATGHRTRWCRGWSATSLLHEADLGVVQVAKTCGPEVRQGAAHCGVACRLEQRQAEALGPDHLVQLVGQSARLRGVEFVESLLDLSVDLGACDLAEVALAAGGEDLRQRRQSEWIGDPGELADVEVADGDVVGEQGATGCCHQVQFHPDLREAVLRDLRDLPRGQRVKEDVSDHQLAAVLLAELAVHSPAERVEFLFGLLRVEGGDGAVVLVAF